MGSIGVFNGPKTRAQRREWMDRELSFDKGDGNYLKILKSAARKFDTVYYAAVERGYPGQAPLVMAAVVLMRQYGEEFVYKAMDEEMGPYQFDCPKGIIDLLPPTTNETALKWRAAQRVTKAPSTVFAD